jgi:hypothetical protein
MMTAMGLFKSDEEKRAEQAARVAELARVEEMPLPRLAEEVLTRSWGRGGPGDAYQKEPGELALDPDTIAGLFTGENYAASEEALAIVRVVEEAIQLLEHVGLVVLVVRGGDAVRYEARPTRAGLRALDAGDVAARLRPRSPS